MRDALKQLTLLRSKTAEVEQDVEAAQRASAATEVWWSWQTSPAHACSCMIAIDILCLLCLVMASIQPACVLLSPSGREMHASDGSLMMPETLGLASAEQSGTDGGCVQAHRRGSEEG